MSWVAAPLGLIACAAMSASAHCHLFPAKAQGGKHHSRQQPNEAPEQPLGCHAVLGCAAYRKPRTFP